MAGIHVHRQADRIQSWLTRAPQLPIDDIDVSTIMGSSFYAAHEEIRQFRDDLMELGRRFDGRWQNPDQRPNGSLPVQLFTVMNIDPDRDRTLSPAPRRTRTGDDSGRSNQS